MKTPTVAVLGSHSALDVCRGAKDEGLKTLVICQSGREQTYERYYKTSGKVGCVDDCMILEQFSDILQSKVQSELKRRHVVFVPHRSFEVYLDFQYEHIEQHFTSPIFGNKYLLKIEERDRKNNQYDVLKNAGIRYPKQFNDSSDIDRLCIVKVAEKTRAFERAFFLVSTAGEFRRESQRMIKQGRITPAALKKAIIEEFVAGVHVNFNFFYSPLARRLELLGTDTRRQTNLEGMLRIPAMYQSSVLSHVPLSFEEAGHMAVTVLESLLEKAFAMGEAFVRETQRMCPPGIIGPFSLQGIITSGPPRKDIVVVDVSPRMPGSPGIAATPYSTYLYGRSVSVGRRVAMEIRSACKKKKLNVVAT